MDYTSDDFLSETLYELSSCIIQCGYSIDVFRKKLESAISKGFQINYRDDNAGVIGYPLLIRAIWGPYHTGEELVKILIEHGADPTIVQMDISGRRPLAYAELLDLMYNKDCDGVVLKL